MNPDDNDEVAVLARAQPVAAPPARVSEILFLPAGSSDIAATVDGKPATAAVKVDAAAIPRLQGDLDAMLKGPVVPYFDYDHAGGKSAGTPKRFRWEEGKGVMCEVAWTQAARTAITDGEYRYFSPEFRFNRKSGVITGLPRHRRTLGSLVNDPAFQEIGAVRASRAQIAGQTNEPPAKKPMNENPIVAALIAAGILTQEEATGDGAAAAVSAKLKDMKEKCEAAKDKEKPAESEATAKRIADLEAEVRASKANVAKTHVEDAVQCGRIPAKDDETRKFWEESIVSRGESAVKALRALPVNPALKASGAGSTETAATQQDAAAEAESEAICARALQISRDQKIQYGAAWEQAQAEVKARRN